MPTLKGIIVFRLILLILQLIIHGKMNDKSNSVGVHIKKKKKNTSQQMQNMHAQCAEPEENAGHAITCFPTRMLQEVKKSAIERKKKKCAKPLKIQKGGSRSCLPSLGNFQRASPSLLPLHMHTH